MLKYPNIRSKIPVMNVVSDIYQKAPDVLGFSCYIWNIEETIQIIKMIKKIRPEILIVLGGPEVSYDTRLLDGAHS
jgi:anaerobic magnesium-protoporphyrin IX monomethyl ester cyclase